MDAVDLKTKKDRLISILKSFDSLLVAFSGGVDSTFLLVMAREISPENLVAATAASAVHPESENRSAQAIAKRLGVRHLVFQSREMLQPDFVANTRDRCYVCKKYLFEDLLRIAAEEGIKHVAHGANRDDLEDYRPGFVAAQEMGIHAPLVEAGLTKDDIRRLSKTMNLATWNKPPMACLATRIPYGVPITTEALKMIDQAEQVLMNLGFNSCRVRRHDSVARIEVAPEDIDRIFGRQVRSTITRRLKAIGFSHISVDLAGYVQGSMNAVKETGPKS